MALYTGQLRTQPKVKVTTFECEEGQFQLHRGDRQFFCSGFSCVTPPLRSQVSSTSGTILPVPVIIGISCLLLVALVLSGVLLKRKFTDVRFYSFVTSVVLAGILEHI